MPVHENSLKALEAHRWKPGSSANKGGRPKGLAATIRAEDLKDGSSDLVARMFRIWRGLEPGHWSGRERLEAGKWISDHGFGKAPEIQLSGELEPSAVSSELENYSAEELRDLLRGLAIKEALPPPEPSTLAKSAPYPLTGPQKP